MSLSILTGASFSLPWVSLSSFMKEHNFPKLKGQMNYIQIKQIINLRECFISILTSSSISSTSAVL